MSYVDFIHCNSETFTMDFSVVHIRTHERFVYNTFPGAILMKCFNEETVCWDTDWFSFSFDDVDFS